MIAPSLIRKREGFFVLSPWRPDGFVLKTPRWKWNVFFVYYSMWLIYLWTWYAQDYEQKMNKALHEYSDAHGYGGENWFYLFIPVCFLSYAHKRNRDTNKKRNAFFLTSEDKQGKFFRKVDIYIFQCIMHIANRI